MNIRNFLITTGATALAVLTINVQASGALLSPRAAGNQIKIASGKTGVNPATLCSRNMASGPKAIEACAEHPLAPMPCCAMAMNR